MTKALVIAIEQALVDRVKKTNDEFAESARANGRTREEIALTVERYSRLVDAEDRLARHNKRKGKVD